MKRFSIITPVWAASEQQEKELLRAIESVKNQTHDKKKIEHIIVNDGSTYPIKIPSYPWISVINQQNLNRISAYNAGFKKAKGEIFTLLDSDDEYDENYLSRIDKWFRSSKEKIFNFGCKYVHSDGGVAYRECFTPRKKKKGHEVFGGGNIVNGTFVFHRSVYDDLGAFPDPIVKDIDCSSVNYGGVRELRMTSPYDFSAYAQIEFPELRDKFMVNHEAEPNKIIKELGNPWGNDMYLFYKYTRKYHSKPMKEEWLYIVHP